MKKITSILLALMLILGVCGSAMLTVGAEEATSDTWDGTASIKWYLDGTNADGAYELKTAEDLAGLAYLVGASNPDGLYTGVYHRADGTVAGYVPGTKDTEYQDSTRIPTSTEGLTSVNGDTFLGKTVLLTVDVVLNEGNAADWATTAPANMWQPIGGNVAGGGRGAFDGTFDGQGHTVSGLYYKHTESKILFVGLFGATGHQFPATIQNLKLTNFYLYSANTVGVLVGRSNKGLTVDNVQVSNGIVETNVSSASAMIGTVFGGPVAIRHCAVEGVKVQGTKYLGIFTGMVVSQDLEIADSYVKNSSVKGETEIGLVIGRIAGGNITIRNVYAVAEIEALGNEEEAETAAVGLVYGVAGDGNKPSAKAIEGFFHVSTVTGPVVNEEFVDMTTPVELTQITGDAAKTTLTGFDFETVWKAVEGDTPVIELRAGTEGGGNEDEDDDFLPEDGGSEDEDTGSTGNTDNGGTTNNGNTNNETNAPETNAPTANEEESGCSSVVGFTGFMLVALISGAAVMLKKEN
ncbi:MAG: hypothetical protein J6B71_10955 [Clostridia bacterium]|nr:hypothetical protein [Clostridia bacterium]